MNSAENMALIMKPRLLVLKVESRDPRVSHVARGNMKMFATKYELVLCGELGLCGFSNQPSHSADASPQSVTSVSCQMQTKCFSYVKQTLFFLHNIGYVRPINRLLNLKKKNF